MDGRSLKSKFHCRFGLALISALLPIAAFASGGDRIPGSRYVSARGAALGDAYLGLADSVADGLFYNPAAIAKVNGFTLEPLNLQLSSNSKLSSAFGTDFYKFQTLSSYKDYLVEHPGTNPGGGFSLLPSFGFKGFGAGVLYQSRMMGEVVGTQIRYRSMYQLIPSVGFGLPLASGVLRVGYVLQWVNQASGDKSVATTASPLGWSEGLAEGKGFSHNFGMSLTLPYRFQPNINVVARNIGGLRLTGKPLMSLASNTSGSIAREPMTVDASMGVLTKVGAGLQFATQLAYRDATDASNTRTLSHLSLGLEITALDRVFLRGGLGNGYPSAGFGLRTSRAEASFAWYSEDLGDGRTPVRDIRYLFHLIFRAF